MSRRRLIAGGGLLVAVLGLVAASVGTGSSNGGAAATGLDGAALFRAKGCASCHTGPDSTTSISIGPPLVDVAAWAGGRRSGVDAEAYVAESIRDPGAFASPAADGDAVMPVLTVTTDEVDRLVAYLLER